MASVTMTLKEYDDLKEQLAFYKRVYESITTPCVSEWELAKYQDGTYDSASVHVADFEKLSSSDREIIENDITMKVSYLGLAGKFECMIGSMCVGLIRKADDEVEEL